MMGDVLESLIRGAKSGKSCVVGVGHYTYGRFHVCFSILCGAKSH